MDATGPKHLMCTISRAKLEQLAEAIVKRSIEPCKKCLADAGITTVDEVLMVGGMTRMPLIYETAKSIFNVEPNRSINPDESVSLGAAVQGSILTGETNDILLLDVTPLSLGINTEFDRVKVMIERNTTIPCKKTETFVNASDMQSQATIQICQGERPMFNDNKQLGMFNIDITPAPRGMAKIEIEFNIDANGILTVTAKNIATGKSQNITITNSSGLSNEEIEKAKADAEAHAEEDKKRVELMNEKNTAETMCFSIEKTMKDVDNEKINEDERKQLTESIEKVRATIKTSESIDEIKAVTNDLAKLMEPISARLYNANAAQNGQPNMEDIMKNPQFAEMFANMNKQTANTTKPSDDVIDAGQI
jgi:molecular chaperone DnaK